MNRVVTVFVVSVIFAAVMLAMQGYYWFRVTQREKESKDLARRLGIVEAKPDDGVFGSLELKKRPAPRNASEARDTLVASLERLIMEAGYPVTLQGLYGQMVVGALAGFLIAVVVLKSPIGIAGAFLGYAPIIYLKSKANSRAEALTSQLPDALDLVARSLQAGHGLAEALRVCAEEMDDPVAIEFGRVYEENNLGRDFRDCLHALVGRNPSSFDVKIFASSVLLQRETGGNLIEILESISRTIRQRFVFKGKVKALTAEARISAVILGALPFFIAMAIYGIRPEYLDPLFNDPLGNFLLVFIACWFSLGVFVMRELTTMEV